jgi:urocanate hydratase
MSSASPASYLSPDDSLIPDAGRVYSLFSKLSALAQDHFGGHSGGRLLLYGSMDRTGAAIALAGNIAGAATLGVDANDERLKQALRYGYCDFLVNNLDEALRILKNEIRKQQPVSVCLEADSAATLREAIERGLQPDILGFSSHSEAVATLLDRGAIPLELQNYEEALAGWTTWTAKTAAALWLPKVDSLASGVFPAGDPRQRWLKFAPRYLGRSMARERHVAMSPDEAERFSTSVAEAVKSGALGTEIVIQR